MTPFYNAMSKRVVYRSTGCGFTSYRAHEPFGHTTGMNRQELEQALVTAISWALDGDTTESALESFELRASVALEEYNRLTRAMEDAERSMEAAARRADAHSKAGKETLAAKARKREADHEGRYNALHHERQAAGSAEELAALSVTEERKIRTLAANVGAFWPPRTRIETSSTSLCAHFASRRG
jgi:hypothetical protein